MSHPLHALSDRWRNVASEMRSWGGGASAGVLERAASELDDLMNEFLRPKEAASEQAFYAESTIRSMLADGRLVNYGEPGRPLVRRGDVWGVPLRGPVDDAVIAHLAGTG